jgi:rare lipoprotein A
MQTALRISGAVFAATLLGSSMASAITHRDLAGGKSPKVVRPSKSRSIGIASWYGKREQGRKMANGERFDFRNFTAASRTLPLGSVIRVVNLENGKSVVVTVTDRGPNARLHRVVDLSQAAAQELDYLGKGLTPVVLSTPAYFEMETAQIASSLTQPPE